MQKRYIHIAKGKVLVFFVKAAADNFQKAFGGVVITTLSPTKENIQRLVEIYS
jgi:hypothetical protein